MPPEIDAAAMPATRATLEMLSTLDIRVVIPGHGDSTTIGHEKRYNPFLK